MFVWLTQYFWNLESLTAYHKNEKTGEYLLMFPVGNVKVKTDHAAYATVEAYLTSRTSVIS